MFKSEREKMTSGELYNSMAADLVEDRTKAKEVAKQFNDSGVRETELRKKMLLKLFGSTNGEFFVEQPFYCCYGYNVSIGENFYANRNLTILDQGKVIIGDNVMLGPNVQLLTACHPIDAEERNAHIEFAKPIVIKDNTWFGGGITVMSGVTIGKNCVIGAGSVVTKDIPDNVVAAGNPCRIIREITVQDKILK